MNIVVATSRGGGIGGRLKKPDYPTMVLVKPGWKLPALADLAVSFIPPDHRFKHTTHIYFMAGYTDITTRILSRNPKHDEITYPDSPEATLQKVIHTIKRVSDLIISAGAIPIFCTVTPGKLRKWNLHRQKIGKTIDLIHTADYTHMQQNLEKAVDLINSEIKTINSSNNMSTPFLHTAIKRRVGSKENPKIQYYYNHLHDGVHPDPHTRDVWAKSLLKVITINRNRSIDSDSDEEKSPKRSWKLNNSF